jgi:hypothetical protein
VIGSSNTVRCITIRSYIDRLQSFISKRNRTTIPFDYVDSTCFIKTVSTTRLYRLDVGGDGPLILITDLLVYCQSTTNIYLLLVATTSGLFVIRYREKHEQTLIQIALPKSIWTISEHIESLNLVQHSQQMIVMNVLGLDRFYCFNIEQALSDQQIHICLSLPNPRRLNPTRMATFVFNDNKTNASFECILGSNHGSIYHHRIQMQTISSTNSIDHFEHTYNELTLSSNEPDMLPCVLSACINRYFLVFTTNNNLICIYQRQS